ncbi:MAG: dTDP-4-dehydrorhamnose reductase [Mariniphaga sp.]
MKLLITGAYGQLGNELKVLSANYPNWQFLFTDYDSLDVTDKSAITRFVAKNNPQLIINCAAYTAVDNAESDVENARKLNALAPGYLAKAAKNAGAGLVHVSTDYVFDGQAYRPYNEKDPTHPISIYGITKREGEEHCLAENPQATIIRTSWLYSSFGKNFVSTILKLGKERQELRVVFDQTGTPTYAADLAETILSLAGHSENPDGKTATGIYHYANEGVASWFDFAKAILELTESSCHVVPVLSEAFPTIAKRPFYSVLDKSKIKSDCQVSIPYWKDSLKICLNKILNKE